jgi:hypothetical protein
MKMQLTTNPLIVSEEMPSSVMGMDSSGMDQACYFLRDKIYSNKVLAVVREYTTNALDEHVKYGIEKPVTVRLQNNTFSVRDYAKGLNESDVRNVFGMYFKSTKRDNNLQSGMFGLGSKAAHCYTDSFYVRSFYDGVCTLYTCVLGGGSNGVPVGQIMKISEEPTNETGLEISVEIEDHRHGEFFANAYTMVETCSKPIEFYNNEEHFVPLVPIETVEKNGFVFKLFNTDPCRVARYANVITKMGEVQYKADTITLIIPNSSLLEKTIMVVEIPVGKMSLPISRESFEDTPSNKRMLESIKNSINEIYNEDAKEQSVFSVEELLADVNQIFLHGKFFTFKKSHLYLQLYPLLRDLKQVTVGLKVEEKDGKKIVALIPNKESKDYWIEKFSNHALSKSKCYMYVTDAHYERCSEDDKKKLEELFLFKKVKSAFFDWPKTNKKEISIDTFKAKISFRRGWYNQDYTGTALEIHNYMRRDASLSEAKDISEAKEQLKNTDWVNSNADDLLNRFTIENTAMVTNKVRALSKNMVNFLIELGWFKAHSPEYLAIIKKIEEKAKQEKEFREMSESVTLNFLSSIEKDKLKNKLSKNKKFLVKASNICKKLTDENSLRGVIFETMQRESKSYWFNKHISRKDLRKILTLK